MSGQKQRSLAIQPGRDEEAKSDMKIYEKILDSFLHREKMEEEREKFSFSVVTEQF